MKTQVKPFKVSKHTISNKQLKIINFLLGIEKAYKKITDPNNESRKQLNNLYFEAKSRVENKRQETNFLRRKKGLKPLQDDNIEEEIKEEMNELKLKIDKEKAFKERMEQLKQQREKEEWEKAVIIDEFKRDKDKEWEKNRDKRVVDWSKFKSKIYGGKNKSPYETRPPSYSKIEERPQIDEKVKYRSLAEN